MAKNLQGLQEQQPVLAIENLQDLQHHQPVLPLVITKNLQDLHHQPALEFATSPSLVSSRVLADTHGSNTSSSRHGRHRHSLPNFNMGAMMVGTWRSSELLLQQLLPSNAKLHNQNFKVLLVLVLNWWRSATLAWQDNLRSHLHVLMAPMARQAVDPEATGTIRANSAENFGLNIAISKFKPKD